eukprot:jgi/Psemu1/68383/estExt_Genemark1.C_4910019
MRRAHNADDERQNRNHNGDIGDRIAHATTATATATATTAITATQHDNEEMVAFLEDSYPQTGPMNTAAILNTVASGKYSPRSGKSSNWTSRKARNSRIICMVVGLTALCGIVFVATGRSYSHSGGLVVSSSTTSKGKGNGKDSGNDSHDSQHRDDGIISFECPSKFELLGAERDATTYSEFSKEMTSDQQEFLKNFRGQVFDEWDMSYTEVKAGLSPFKTKYYPKYLKEGMSVYESAMGIGLNLFMTLELLGEQDPPISGITVYGNDFVPESIEEAKNVVLTEGVLPAGNHPGVLCAGNSLDLSHVPTGVFDLVYTGYISPLNDPLHLEPSDDTAAEEWEWEEYGEICEAFARHHQKDNKLNKRKNQKKTDWMGAYLWEKVMVPSQRDWHGKWVAEMTRIAKPGVPVLVESASVPYCDNQDDWGGVAKSFWKEAARENTYNWNVDPDSIEFMDDALYPQRAVHCNFTSCGALYYNDFDCIQCYCNIQETETAASEAAAGVPVFVLWRWHQRIHWFGNDLIGQSLLPKTLQVSSLEL